MTAAGAGPHAKRLLRDAVLAQRDATDPAVRAADSAILTRHLLDRIDAALRRVVCSYATFGAEFDTSAWNEAVLAAGGTLLLPRIVRTPQRHLELHAVGDPARDLIAGPWGIREPDPQRCPRMTLADATCVLVPGVAFDATGARLGYGGGFYDRLLATAPTVPRIAAAFDLQLVDAVPVDAHDLRVDRVITPTREIALPPRPDARR